MDLTPPKDIMGELPATITVPRDGTVLVDAVSFRPVFSRKP
jgi:hypothetical protein